jgi:hypothetical protein
MFGTIFGAKKKDDPTEAAKLYAAVLHRKRSLKLALLSQPSQADRGAREMEPHRQGHEQGKVCVQCRRRHAVWHAAVPNVSPRLLLLWLWLTPSWSFSLLDAGFPEKAPTFQVLNRVAHKWIDKVLFVDS